LFFNTINPDILKLNFDLKKTSGNVKQGQVGTDREYREFFDDVINGGAIPNNVTNQATIRQEALDKQQKLLMESEEYTKIIKTYDTKVFEETPLSEREQLKYDWAKDCEIDSNGNDTDYLFEEIYAVEAGAIKFVCVQ